MDIKKILLSASNKIDSMEAATDRAFDRLAAHEHTARWLVIITAVVVLGVIILLVKAYSS